MGKLELEVFNESCCDGGSAPITHNSTQACGCDPGAGWVCFKHRHEEKGDPLAAHLKDVVNVSWNNAGRLRDSQDHIMNAATGLAAEAGEVLDIHKKMFYHRPKDYRLDLVNEIGDVYFYLLKLQELHGITTQEALDANKAKLAVRYAQVFKVCE